MWYKAGKTILRFRISLLLILLLATAFMAWQASKVQLSYDFTRALPTDNPKFIEYQDFLKQFGTDGNTLVIGLQSDQFYEKDFFNEVHALSMRLKKVPGVNNILSVPDAVNLINDDVNQQLVPKKIFNPPYATQAALDSAKLIF